MGSNAHFSWVCWPAEPLNVKIFQAPFYYLLFFFLQHQLITVSSSWIVDPSPWSLTSLWGAWGGRCSQCANPAKRRNDGADFYPTTEIIFSCRSTWPAADLITLSLWSPRLSSLPSDSMLRPLWTQEGGGVHFHSQKFSIHLRNFLEKTRMFLTLKRWRLARKISEIFKTKKQTKQKNQRRFWLLNLKFLENVCGYLKAFFFLESFGL